MESRRSRYPGVCETCRKKVWKGELVFIDRRVGHDGWMLWHFECYLGLPKKATNASRKAAKPLPRVWVDTSKFTLPWEALDA